MTNNKFFWIMIALTVAVLVVGFGGKTFVDKVADQVILKLQKEYCPSPFGPGLDPDKIDPDKIIKKKDDIKRFKTTTFEEKPVEWDINWEKQRTSFFRKKFRPTFDWEKSQPVLVVKPSFSRLAEKDRLKISEELPLPAPNPYL